MIYRKYLSALLNVDPKEADRIVGGRVMNVEARITAVTKNRLVRNYFSTRLINHPRPAFSSGVRELKLTLCFSSRYKFCLSLS